MAIIAMLDEYELVCMVSNVVIYNDLGWPSHTIAPLNL